MHPTSSSLNELTYTVALIAGIYVVGFATIRCLRYLLIDPDEQETAETESKVK